MPDTKLQILIAVDESSVLARPCDASTQRGAAERPVCAIRESAPP
jgi:hypothetical protein